MWQRGVTRPCVGGATPTTVTTEGVCKASAMNCVWEAVLDPGQTNATCVEEYSTTGTASKSAPEIGKDAVNSISTCFALFIIKIAVWIYVNLPAEVIAPSSEGMWIKFGTQEFTPQSR